MEAQVQQFLLLLGKGILVSAIVIVLTFVGLRLWHGVVRRLIEHAKSDNLPRDRQLKLQTLASVSQWTGTILLIVIATLMVLGQFTDVAPLLAGAGVIGIAIGLGAQAFVRDLIGGFFILLENHYAVGDIIKVNNTYDGLVEHLDLRRTVIRNLEGWVYNIPNGEIRVVANMTRGWSRIVVDISVPLHADVDYVMQVLEDVSSDLLEDEQVGKHLLERPEILGVEAFGEYQVVIRVLLKTQPTKQWEVGRRYRALVKKAFDREGIEIPVPHRIVIAKPELTPEAARSFAHAGRRE